MFCMVENQEKRTKTGKLTIKKNNKELDKLTGRMTRPETLYNVYRGFFIILVNYFHCDQNLFLINFNV